MDRHEEERLLTRWVLKELFRMVQLGGFRDSVLDDIRAQMPPKAAAHPDRAARWAVRKLGQDDVIDRVLFVYLDWVRAMLKSGEARDSWQEMPIEDLRYEIMLHSRCAALRWDIEPVFAAALETMDAEDQRGYQDRLTHALRWAREWEEQERQRLSAARAQASGLQAARGEAARQAERADRAAQAAAQKVAEAEHARRDLEADLSHARAELAQMQALLAERDEQIARIVQDYEQRVAALSRGESAPSPLLGRSVLVVADPNRAVAYRAEAMALGATDVEFVDGMAHPGEQVRQLARAADTVVLCLAWCKHSTCDMLRRHAGERLREMRVAGLRSFREALAELAP